MENTPDIDRICQLVYNLTNPETRPEAMEELGKMRDIPKASELLAIILWHSYGSIAALVQEVVCLYPLLSYTKQIKVQANRTCNALALLQCVAAHNDTRIPFFQCTCCWLPTFPHLFPLYPLSIAVYCSFLLHCVTDIPFDFLELAWNTTLLSLEL